MKVNEYFDQVVVINLDRRQDRMEKLGKQLDELGITYERFPAIDAQILGVEGMVAGTMSHVMVMKKYAGKRILILEDDALFCEDFNEKFDQVIQELPDDWHIFYLGALLPKDTGQVEPIGNKYWFKQIMSTGSHAYCIRPDIMNDIGYRLDTYQWYIDIGLRLENERYNCYIAQPNLVTQFPSFSDLRGKEVDDF